LGLKNHFIIQDFSQYKTFNFENFSLLMNPDNVERMVVLMLKGGSTAAVSEKVLSTTLMKKESLFFTIHV
jgi:hypothetical protein